jgi:hypothetical protein
VGERLYFTSLEPVPEEVAEAVCAELRQEPSEQPWLLCEPPGFYDADEDGKLRGGTKLNLRPSADEMEAVAASPAERDDIQELVRLLCAWSERYGIVWLLDIDGHPLGRIADGSCRGDLLGKLEAMAELATFLGEEFPEDMPAGEGDDDSEPPEGPGLRIWPGPEE